MVNRLARPNYTIQIQQVEILDFIINRCTPNEELIVQLVVTHLASPNDTIQIQKLENLVLIITRSNASGNNLLCQPRHNPYNNMLTDNRMQ